MIDIKEGFQIEGLEEIQKQSLKQLVKDREIAAFLNNHHLSYTYYRDYWSELLNYYEDRQICHACHGFNECPKVLKGLQHVLEYDGEDIKNRLVYCPFGKSRELEGRILSHVVFNNVSSSLALTNLFELPFVKNAARLSPVNQRALAGLLSYLDQPGSKGIYLSGSEEGLHTLLMAGLMNALARKGYDVGICHFPTFLLDMKASFRSYQDDSYLNQLLDVPYLLIDGIGEENITSWSRDEVILTILSYRSINNRPTFISSMYTRSDLTLVYTMKRNDKVEKLRAHTIMTKIANMCHEYVIE